MTGTDENTPLLDPERASDRRLSRLIQKDDAASSIVKSHASVDEQALSGSTVGERLAYNDYTTIDWLHDLVKDSYRLRDVHSKKSIKGKALALFDSSSGWIAAALIGALTACVAYLVDIAAATVSDWKLGHCTTNPFLTREACCSSQLSSDEQPQTSCAEFVTWREGYTAEFGVYVGFALVFGLVSASVTMLTKASLPSAGDSEEGDGEKTAAGKTMYMAAGSGIPEIKTILGGFVIPDFLSVKVLVIKAAGAVFAVSTGPFVHISTCVGFLVASIFPKYRDNGRKMREMLSAACAAGLSVAFGAPIGGVLFSYEEISTYFPRKVLWRAFLCSAVAAMVLKELNPTGTGKLVLFETNYGTSYSAVHYLVFVVLEIYSQQLMALQPGIAGGIFGGLFCRLNFLWSKTFRKYDIIKNHPVFEVFLIVLATALLQYPNPLIREPGDMIIKTLLVDCKSENSAESWVCQNEARTDGNMSYVGWLVYGTLAKLALTIITFGIKVPSGVIIPALDAGALFGRLLGQYVGGISPGIFAMVGAAAFLAGVSRMTLSLCVIMFELTGELDYVLPHMVAILIAKWVADSLGKESVYDLAQNVLGHPFLDLDHSLGYIQMEDVLVEELIPPEHTMEQITIHVPPSNKVRREILEKKLAQLESRGLMDAGLVLVQNNNILQGYLAEGELSFGLRTLGEIYPKDAEVRLLGDAEEGEFDLSSFVDRTPMVVCAKAPMEYAVEMFGKLGLRHLMVTEEGTGRMIGVIIKKRLVAYLDGLKHD
ncbi:hypothetical protein E4T44_08580 [Aureobasidium sp. EXF-8845]|nr:hypothetical protein E4T44_08580 [Aureobasidium sp. EXF-8845]KAI4843262.1 hypothetical protein E4T45_08702 [Aureobasidium sp. EXF-8846]